MKREGKFLVNERVNIISDLDDKKIVVIGDIRFKGKRNIDWEEVEQYLKEYIGTCYEVVETSDKVFIGLVLCQDLVQVKMRFSSS